MKNFCEWLGVNEKIAKLVVWIFIGMCMLIIINTALESLGLPFYKLTVENLKNLNNSKALNFIVAWLLAFFNFYSIVLLVFRIRDIKKIFPFAVLYLVLDAIVNLFFDYVVAQIYIPIYIMAFSYFYSKKKIKYIFYGLFSLIINSFVQYITYLYKMRFIDITKSNYLVRMLGSVDFLLVMFVIILVKEIIIKNKEKRK